MRALGILLWLASPIVAFAAEPFGRASLAETTQYVPGQQIAVVVEVFAPDFFTSPPQFPLFEVPDALVTFSSERAQNVVQTVGGVQYSGIRKVYAVVPEQSGSFTIPAIRIPLGWSNEGVPAKANVVTSPLSFDVAATTQQDVVFAASGLELRQSFDRDPASLRAGDAVVRTVVITAAETQSLAMPPVNVGLPFGLKQYTKPAKLEDGVPAERGETVSRRTDTIVYTAQAGGDFDLPEVSYPWFDVDGHSPAAATLPAIRFHVSKSERGSGIPTTSVEAKYAGPQADLAIIASTFSVTALLLFGWWNRHRVVALAKAIQHAYLASPGHRLRQLQRMIRSGDAATVYAALHAWSREWNFATLSAWSKTQPATVAAEVIKLERSLFGGGDDVVDRRALARIALTASPHQPSHRDALPPLNPPLLRPTLP
ncbi:BatD family protein [Rhizobium sp. CCGE 510]|uniref:BatD family protein n=1 Tax=Rhizobium sp. CCGE 510 TaxID=1132836 RepID=UPI00027B8911|nr:BatD family protein [Rhizobium sp. CCGE 510]EJT01967.1 hypothetical protein RCCGE510_25731 [Rhizobium sp. CCGE 510]